MASVTDTPESPSSSIILADGELLLDADIASVLSAVRRMSFPEDEILNTTTTSKSNSNSTKANTTQELPGWIGFPLSVIDLAWEFGVNVLAKTAMFVTLGFAQYPARWIVG